MLTNTQTIQFWIDYHANQAKYKYNDHDLRILNIKKKKVKINIAKVAILRQYKKDEVRIIESNVHKSNEYGNKL